MLVSLRPSICHLQNETYSGCGCGLQRTNKAWLCTTAVTKTRKHHRILCSERIKRNNKGTERATARQVDTGTPFSDDTCALLASPFIHRRERVRHELSHELQPRTRTAAEVGQLESGLNPARPGSTDLYDRMCMYAVLTLAYYKVRNSHRLQAWRMSSEKRRKSKLRRIIGILYPAPPPSQTPPSVSTLTCVTTTHTIKLDFSFRSLCAIRPYGHKASDYN